MVRSWGHAIDPEIHGLLRVFGGPKVECRRIRGFHGRLVQLSPGLPEAFEREPDAEGRDGDAS
ncbi:hypothetical protein CH063_10560, partial [Colletotrichum higginsianum]